MVQTCNWARSDLVAWGRRAHDDACDVREDAEGSVHTNNWFLGYFG